MNIRFLKFCRKIAVPPEPTWRVWVLILICIVYTGGTEAKNSNDPLKTPAEKISPHASMFFDTVNTGKRLIVVGERGLILYSKDDGLTWTQADVPVSVTLTAVYFPTPQKGWAVGHDGVVLHTSDGGNSWRMQLDGNQANALIRDHLGNLIEMKKSAGAGQKKIDALEYLLSDAETGLQEGPTKPFMDVWFNNETEGIVIGAFGLILGTGDGGSTWTPLTERLDNPDSFHYYGISQTDTSLFIAGEGGMLFRSEDLGKNWTRLASPYEGSFFGVIGEPTDNFVIAFGMQGTAYRSDDNGDTWQQININSTTSLSGGTVLPNGALAISGINGILFYSRDGNRGFQPLPVKFPGCMAVTNADTDGNILILTGLGGLMQTRVKNSQ